MKEVSAAEFQRLRKKKKSNKYGVAPLAQRTSRSGVTFHSKAEKESYETLLTLQRIRGGEHKFIVLRQVPFALPGRTTFRADFLVLDRNVPFDRSIRIIDTKRVRTEAYQIKKRQILEVYGLEIEEW